MSEAEVARQPGVHRQSVNRWAQKVATEGPRGLLDRRTSLKHAGRVGRPPRLSDADRRRIERALKRGPEALGYATGLCDTRTEGAVSGA